MIVATTTPPASHNRSQLLGNHFFMPKAALGVVLVVNDPERIVVFVSFFLSFVRLFVRYEINRCGASGTDRGFCFSVD